MILIQSPTWHCCVQTACYAKHVGSDERRKKDECSTGFAVSCSPQNSMQLMGFRAGTTSKTCGAEPADNASPAKLFVTELLQRKRSNHGCRELLTSGCSQLRVPCPEHWLRAQALSTEHTERQRKQRRPSSQGPFVTAPLAIHNHKAIFGWAANLFLAAAPSQTTTAEKSGPARLGDPVPGRGDVEGHPRHPSAAHPQPLLARCPHPTTVGRAWPAVPSLVCPAPANTARPLQFSLYLSICFTPFCSFMPDI